MPSDPEEELPYSDNDVSSIAFVIFIADIISSFSWRPNIPFNSFRGNVSLIKVIYEAKSSLEGA